jgi:hypothetical protein
MPFRTSEHSLTLASATCTPCQGKHMFIVSTSQPTMHRDGGTRESGWWCPDIDWGTSI